MSKMANTLAAAILNAFISLPTETFHVFVRQDKIFGPIAVQRNGESPLAGIEIDGNRLSTLTAGASS
jgi:hypothetical protein